MKRSVLVTCLASLAALLAALPAVAAPAQQPSSALDQVLNEIVAREHGLLDRLRQYRPLVETYLQSVKPDGARGAVPVSDRYFLGRLELGEGQTAGDARPKDRPSDTLLDLYHYSVSSNPDGFARMMTLDAASFDRENYRFEFVSREFLGEVRTLVFDVVPTKIKGAKPGRFTGRIWVEDLDNNIVRFNGLYGSIFDTNLHFDSWRINVAPGLWLPAYIYTEEPDRPGGDPKMKHKGQTRIWGYDVKRRNAEAEFTKVLIDAPLTRDDTEAPGQVSPVESFRAWEREAEDNVLGRLQGAGFLAPEGGVSEVLETVVSNLEVTNDLDIQPPVRCRVLLTTPLESFTVGHTIVLSRGLIDVLPDEASLAAVLAQELGHIMSGHQLDTRYAFSDQMLVDDKQALQHFHFERDLAEQREAADKAAKLLANSPYKGDLAAVGLFMKALAANAEPLATLIQPHFGNRIGTKDQLQGMAQIVGAAPELNAAALEQIAALPLGGRVKVDPWTARAELMKNTRVAPVSAREKMAFQVTPLMPHLVRYGAPAKSTESDTAAAEVRGESR